MAHVANARAGFVRLEAAKDRHRAVAWAQQSGQDAEQCGFACAVFADEDVAAAGLQID